VTNEAGFIVDLVGTRTRAHYKLKRKHEAPFEAREIVPPLPRFREGYFQWVDLLESVRDARDRYVVCELGAGYGKWCVRAGRAIGLLNPMPFKCVAAEAEPQHFLWMREHFSDNGVDPADHDLLWAAAGPRSGVVPFWMGEADTWYGQAACDADLPVLDARARRRLRARGLLGRPPRTSNQRRVSWVPMVTLWELIADETYVDLLDLDVQGLELEVLEAAEALVDHRVRRVHIGTHSREIEDGLRTLFRRLNWRCLHDYPGVAVAQTPYGEISFKDGVQSWVNPALKP
jgi:FkbM family methyltransferase